MGLHISVIGIDGSGKSTVAEALPAIIAGEHGLRAASAGTHFSVRDPEEDHLGPGFQPEGLPASAHLSRRFRRIAKRAADGSRAYPAVKLLQMLFQDDAARALERRHDPDVVVSDGNLLLCTAGRAANCLCPASAGTRSEPGWQSEAGIRGAIDQVLTGTPMATGSKGVRRALKAARHLVQISERVGIRGVWMPDVVVYLDVSPQVALSRIRLRGEHVDRHENGRDLAQARGMYLRALNAIEHGPWCSAVYRVACDGLTPGETLREVMHTLRPHLTQTTRKSRCTDAPLGTVEGKLTTIQVMKKVLSRRYVLNYLVRKWSEGAWREPAFVASRLGRQCLRQGYSAGVMKAIYDEDPADCRAMDRVYLNYPMHRSVRERLSILAEELDRELSRRLQTGRSVRIFTAPSGFAYDILGALERVARRQPEAMKRVRLVAADLDPHDELGPALRERARSLGIQFKFHRANIVDPEARALFAETGPYDMVLLVGLTSWLPKTDLVSHLKWIRRHLQGGGVLVTDVFTPAAYSLSGRYVGYRANYYTPEVFRSVAGYCGFDTQGGLVRTGTNGINHVVLLPAGRPVERHTLETHRRMVSRRWPGFSLPRLPRRRAATGISDRGLA